MAILQNTNLSITAILRPNSDELPTKIVLPVGHNYARIRCGFFKSAILLVRRKDNAEMALPQDSIGNIYNAINERDTTVYQWQVIQRNENFNIDKIYSSAIGDNAEPFGNVYAMGMKTLPNDTSYPAIMNEASIIEILSG